MWFSGLTSVRVWAVPRSRRSRCRAEYIPMYPPPTIRIRLTRPCSRFRGGAAANGTGPCLRQQRRKRNDLDLAPSRRCPTAESPSRDGNPGIRASSIRVTGAAEIVCYRPCRLSADEAPRGGPRWTRATRPTRQLPSSPDDNCCAAPAWASGCTPSGRLRCAPSSARVRPTRRRRVRQSRTVSDPIRSAVGPGCTGPSADGPGSAPRWSRPGTRCASTLPGTPPSRCMGTSSCEAGS